MLPEHEHHLLERSYTDTESYNGILESIFDAVIIHRDSVIVFANDSAANLIGAIRASEVVGTYINHYVLEDDIPTVEAYIQSIDASIGKVPILELRLRRLDGTIIATEITGRKVLLNDNEIVYVGVIRDVTSTKKIQSSFELTQSQLNNIINNLDIGIWSYDRINQESLLCSESIVEISGLPTDDLQGLPKLWNRIIHPEDRDEVIAHQEKLLQGQILKLMYRIIHQRTGEVRYVHDLIVPVMDVNGVCVRLDGMITDVTEKARNDRKIHSLAYQDELTSLPNRRAFREKLIQVLDQAGKTGRKIFLAYLDLDKFKMINDSLGIAAGDAFLLAVSERLRTLKSSAYVSRIGGDEFVIIFREDITELEIEKCLREVIGLFAIPFEMDGYEFYMNASIGAAVYPDHASNYDSLLNCAETAMRLAKQSMKAQKYALYSNSCENQPLMMRMFNDLNKAIANNEFFLLYQPKHSVLNGELRGSEALIRWRHPEFDVLSPDRFIPIVEEFGMMNTLGRWIIREACSQIREWMDNGNICRISINLSARQFQMDNIVDIVKEEIERARIEPGLLGLEITESMAMDIEKSMNTLSNLHQLGVLISIDDFGTGYSSLNYLKRLPIHELKIDRSFIRDIEEGEGDKAIVTAIVALAHNLRLKVVAEGVETAGQLQVLKQIGCDEAQGYYFNKPLTPGEFELCFKAVNA
ncbi:EAL domain-containing protein [Paenibacillus nanensis]|uniref:EAL domain-containing protein n=1 Tax=Paenibacillus nanensis TaxID=393251 RepID=A0A3A1UHI3_9BACL|nr:EAL domain-containing protein [Paenibacillus nanensis]RIX46031.1 EAL domain-containing protein [Paenibacillus nanensis]